MIKNKKHILTIAIATYNVEKYISNCLQCIKNQTFKNFEVICIDDASTDNTVKNINKIVKDDNRFNLIRKEKNEGLSVARNQALLLAKGEYIIFMDGDDLIDLELFRKAISLATENNSDLVVWDYLVFWKENEIKSLKFEKSRLRNILPKNKNSLLKQPAFTWLKLIKLETARKLNINFPKGLTKQDIPVHWHLITMIDKITILPEKLTYYRQQPNATSYKIDKRLFDIVEILDITEEFLNHHNIYEEFSKIFIKQKLELMFVMQDTIDIKLKQEALRKIKKRLEKNEIEYVNSKEELLPQIRFFYLFLQGSFFSTIKYNLWVFLRKIYRSINKKRDAYSIFNRKN